MTQKIIGFLFTYVMVFWVVIFCVLPVGVKREDSPLPGNDHGAPKNANMKKKFIYTALITLVLVGTYTALREYGIIDLGAMIEQSDNNQ